MFKNFGTNEVIIIVLLLVLFFGSKKIPEFVRGLTEAIKEIKKALEEK